MQQTTITADFNGFIEKHSEPAWLAGYRKKNFAVFKERPLKKSKYVDVEKLESLLKVTKAQNPLPAIDGNGVRVFSFQEALEKWPDKIRAALAGENAPKDQFEAFINAFFTDGFAVFVEKNFAGEKIDVEFMPKDGSISKNFFFLESENKTLVFEKISGHGVFAVSENNFVAQEARVEIARLHSNQDTSTGFFYNQSILSKDSALLNGNAWINGHMMRSNTFNNLCGKGGSVRQFDALFLSRQQLFDLNNTAMHIETDTQSNTVFRGIVAGKSKSVFDAMIKIARGAQRSNAFLQAHGMLLSAEASSNNIPGLEIEADDVKASHSASVAQVDEEQVYYLQSRGISRKDALRMIISGFLESVLLNWNENLSEKVFIEIEEKTGKIEDA
ncbi:MAG: SufD family Fe-S cluster assembly protein [Candidatus Diapherotrites archaeon]|nr:SufD family Fe-S cluster assembly protein [Candidatus Diapherotrites archaeon]